MVIDGTGVLVAEVMCSNGQGLEPLSLSLSCEMLFSNEEKRIGKQILKYQL